MRADMAKVLVERPRPGSRDGSRPAKGYRKRTQKSIEAGVECSRERMEARCGGTRYFNENLGPLRKFLDSNVGRPWDKIHAEICQHVNRGSVVQKHILTHLFQYVVTNVILIDGQPFNGTPGWLYREPLRTTTYHHDQWYVCPKSGLLRRSRPAPRERAKRTDGHPTRVVRVSKTEMCLKLSGGWELVTISPLPDAQTQGPSRDVVRGVNVHPWSGDAARGFYGTAVYATARRPISKRELKNLPVPMDWWK